MITQFKSKAPRDFIILLTLSAIQFIHIVDFMIMMPLGPQFLRLFSITPQQFSTLISAYTVSAGVFGFLGSFFLNRVPRKKALLTVLIGFTVGTFFCGLSHTYSMLLVSRLVTGAFGGVVAALVLALVGDIVPHHRRGKAMGIVMSAFAVASIVGVPLGLYLATRFMWEMPFFGLAGLGVLAVLAAVRIIPDIPFEPYSDSKNQAIVHVLAEDKNPVRALVLTAVIMLGQFSIIPLISTYMVTNVGFTDAQLTWLYILGGVGSIIISPISGRLADRFGQINIFMIFSLLCVIPQFGLTHLSRQGLAFPLFISTLLFIFSSGRMVCGMALIVSSVRSRHRAGFMSANACVQQLSAGLAAYISGMIVFLGPTGELIRYNVVGYLAVTSSLLAMGIARKIESRAHLDTFPTALEQEMVELMV